MNYFLRACLWYMTAVLLGLAWVLVLVPYLSVDVLADYVPAQDDAFVQAYFIGSVVVFVAATLTALIGFFMTENRALRRATLTLPAWVPMLYAVIILIAYWQ